MKLLEDSFKLIQALAEHPVPIAYFALVALVPPTMLIYCATKFAFASIETFLVYALISICGLVYSMWVVIYFTRNLIGKLYMSGQSNS